MTPAETSERAAIVAWLREQVPIHDATAAKNNRKGNRYIAREFWGKADGFAEAATAIERGEHLPRTPAADTGVK